MDLSCYCCNKAIAPDEKLVFQIGDEKTLRHGVNQGFSNVTCPDITDKWLVSSDFYEDLQLLFDQDEIDDILLCTIYCTDCNK